jgi:hypothetical protein
MDFLTREVAARVDVKAAAAMWPDSVTTPPIPKPHYLRKPPLGSLDSFRMKSSKGFTFLPPGD